MIERVELHELVDRLSERDLPAAQSYLRYLADLARDPFLRALAEAPIDDEPETEEERLAVEEAKAEVARGEVYPWEQVKAELDAMDAEDSARRGRRKRAS